MSLPPRALVASAGILATLLGAATALHAGTVERLAPYEGPASGEVKAVLEPEGYTVKRGDATVACSIWFAKTIAGKEEGAFFGVVSFEDDGSDFRGQPVKAGYYTLRYARMPMDGNHMGAAPTSDFLLLIPVGEDPGPSRTPASDELAALSAKVSGASHPSPLNLARTGDQKQFPAVSFNDEGHEVFYVKVNGADGPIPIGIVVTGVAEQ